MNYYLIKIYFYFIYYRPVTISWFKDKAPLMTTEDGRYDLIETIMNEGIKSELLIRNSDRRDGGLYTCLASNSFGHDDTNIQLVVQGRTNQINFKLDIWMKKNFFLSQNHLIHQVILK